MTIEIDEKQLPEDTVDDYEVKASINNKSDPGDKYALECKICKNIMKLEHSIHTISLLFQFYICICPLNGTHIIVRDKRTNESVVYQSKGILRVHAKDAMNQILAFISQISGQYYDTGRLTREVVVDAHRLYPIVDEHKIAEYESRVDIYGLLTGHVEEVSNMNANIRQHDSSEDLTAKKHLIRAAAADVSLGTFMLWLCRLARDTYASMARSTI